MCTAIPAGNSSDVAYSNVCEEKLTQAAGLGDSMVKACSSMEPPTKKPPCAK
eukprot:CAMPEP_0168408252 /NCGR_PEP_ID=MMETSP0228-20121227/26577_1 /TAXON_ID=133427 /ORGANISM="Protoceratium reticulatum, Strain CCCM 535 (=CCMP 1889)" /LENGTH=51 /DNA_ID=CAMNT_0008421937 /DNA_START=52 /DNA_END=207 /DNA_ORIENTATION=+